MNHRISENIASASNSIIDWIIIFILNSLILVKWRDSEHSLWFNSLFYLTLRGKFKSKNSISFQRLPLQHFKQKIEQKMIFYTADPDIGSTSRTQTEYKKLVFIS